MIMMFRHSLVIISAVEGPQDWICRSTLLACSFNHLQFLSQVLFLSLKSLQSPDYFPQFFCTNLHKPLTIPYPASMLIHISLNPAINTAFMSFFFTKPLGGHSIPFLIILPPTLFAQLYGGILQAQWFLIFMHWPTFGILLFRMPIWLFRMLSLWRLILLISQF